MARFLEDELEELAPRHRRRGGEMPDLAERPVVLAEGDEAPCDVLQVVQRVRLIEAAEPTGALSLDGRQEDEVAHRGVSAARTEVVGGPTDRDLDHARAVGGEELRGQVTASAVLAATGVAAVRPRRAGAATGPYM